MTTLIVHSHQLNEHGEPGKEYSARLIEWIELLIQQKVENILLTGWIATPGVPVMHSEAAFKYLIAQWVDRKKLYTEKTWALETVGEFIFARNEHDEDILAAWTPIIHLSSNYHVPRMKIISWLVWWNLQYISFHGIPWFHRSPEDEIRSINAFKNTFSWIPIGDLKAIEERLWKKHPLYKNHPSNPYKQEFL